MKISTKIAFLISTLLLLAGCGQVVVIPSAHVAKLTTKSGLQKGIIPPSTMKLEGMCRICDGIIMVEASDFPIEEKMTIFMPKDKLNLTVDTRGTVAINNDETNVDKIFARVTAIKQEERISLIPMEKVYSTYAKPIIREAVRSVLTQYTIAQVMENRDDVSQKLTQTLRDKLGATPIQIIRFGLADVQPPDVVVNAEIARKKREIEIFQTEADKQIKLKEAEAAYEVATKQQLVDILEAETQVLVQEKLDKGVTAAFVTQRALKVLSALATSENKVIFIPTEALKNPAIMVGLTQEALKDQKHFAKPAKKG